MKNTKVILIVIAMSLFFLGSCASKEVKKAPTSTEIQQNFLTLADLNAQPTLKEGTREFRIINKKTKAFIKRGDINQAKQTALTKARIEAVDEMVRELLPPDDYNKNFDRITTYMSSDINKYVDKEEITDEKRIYNGLYWGIAATLKINRQKVLVALQKDLKVINTAATTLITVMTSRKNINLSSVGLKFSDIEQSFLKQLQTDLNQRGLTAMDLRNAINSLSIDAVNKRKFSRISNQQFMAAISGSSSEDAAIQAAIEQTGGYYSTGLDLLKQLAKVVVEVNITAIGGNVRQNVSMTLDVTATNISSNTGGAIARTQVIVGRRGGPNVIPSVIISALLKDALKKLKGEFIPQVIREMSTISVGGNKLIGYQLVFKDFQRREARKIRGVVKGLQNDSFRYLDYDNSVPSIITVDIRYAGKLSELSDTLMDSLEGSGYNINEPIIAKGLTDLVFSKR